MEGSGVTEGLGCFFGGDDKNVLKLIVITAHVFKIIVLYTI